jgi:ribosome modulation factor
MTDIIEAGGLAYWGGVPRDWPPYDLDDPKRGAWLEGWDAARDECEAAPPTVPMDEVWREMAEPVA